MAAPSRGASDDLERGRALYVKKGCYECHGYAAQGALLTGPALGPSPVPLPAMIAYVRAPKGQMPPYSAKILSDGDAADIHAWLASVPSSPALEHVPLLGANSTRDRQVSRTSAAAASDSHGYAVFTAHCAACHGAQGEGAIGPSLVGIGKGRTSDAIATFVRNPTGAMPKLFPAPLSEQDVLDVSKYVAALR
ncbi:c-type cytochrome [Paraburkholderia acidicola]|uniref:C-type cytochrome n=1 Tax=Paraburkholderia acidicola TaxID=1912599 RepID=A0ABV1LWK4_9BURK